MNDKLSPSYLVVSLLASDVPREDFKRAFSSFRRNIEDGLKSEQNVDLSVSECENMYH